MLNQNQKLKNKHNVVSKIEDLTICPNCDIRLTLICLDEKGCCYRCSTCGYSLYVENTRSYKR